MMDRISERPQSSTYSENSGAARNNNKPPRPGQLVPQSTEHFDKRTWCQDLSKIKKEFLAFDRERYAPFLRMKKDAQVTEFLEDIEKTEKKYEIGVMREKGVIRTFVTKQKQDVDCVRTMINQSKRGDPTFLDRIQAKV